MEHCCTHSSNFTYLYHSILFAFHFRNKSLNKKEIIGLYLCNMQWLLLLLLLLLLTWCDRWSSTARVVIILPAAIFHNKKYKYLNGNFQCNETAITEHLHLIQCDTKDIHFIMFWYYWNNENIDFHINFRLNISFCTISVLH